MAQQRRPGNHPAEFRDRALHAPEQAVRERTRTGHRVAGVIGISLTP